MKKLIFLAIIGIVALSFFPDAAADIPGGSFLAGIADSAHSFFDQAMSAVSSIFHKLTDMLSSLMGAFTAQTKANP